MRTSSVLIIAAAFLLVPPGALAQEVIVDPEGLDFGEVEVGTTAELTLAITCGPGTPCQFQNDEDSFTIVDDPGGVYSFTLDPIPSLGQFVDGDPPFNVYVDFTPDATGTFVGLLEIESNDDDPPGGIVVVPLTGTGIPPAAVPASGPPLLAVLGVVLAGAMAVTVAAMFRRRGTSTS